MPYKLSGKSVMIYQDGKWTLLKKHKNREEALAHLRALQINAKGHGKVRKC